MNPEILGGVVVALISLGGIIACITIMSRAINSEEWNRVDCEIIESSIQFLNAIPPGRYYPIVKYRYTVDGVMYEGRKVRFGGSATSKFAATDICRRYQSGRVAKVSVDPKNPEKSVLLPGLSFQIFIALAIFIICFGVGFHISIGLIYQ